MAGPARDEQYTAYVAARLPWLQRVAYLLCQDWDRADDLVQVALTRLYVRWNRVGSVENVDGYARTVLLRVFLAEQRTGWWKRVSTVREPPEPSPDTADRDGDLDLRTALRELAPRQRAAVVLRFYCDLSVEQTAEVLDCSPGTVKSQTSRGLAALRRALVPTVSIEEGTAR
ncbi:SigE family RNA polymerase sigma factor [Actinoallomurus iriomotensis]|jgi:RNA polymerase sigma-70 factor (sigma-E family)|uniref:SigE family RNA polymerase sigma factor n=1 Tax=Actinoallomurus iriomotensis TaxID=478107 RepID=UPI002553E300|nr:SigE family RNA polymerase sigma factor [Actinoallomurus iriomotensis]